MKALTAITLLVFGLCLNANADIYKWVDENGNVHYGDKPAPEYTKSTQVVRHTSGQRSAFNASDSRTITSQREKIEPKEASQDKKEGEDAQSYYCEQARDIYRSYVDAPRLYRTGKDGQREYLSDDEMAATIANARATVAEWCN